MRDVLNRIAPRRMAIFDPLEVELTNWEEAEVKQLEGAVNPEDSSLGMRKIPLENIYGLSKVILGRRKSQIFSP